MRLSFPLPCLGHRGLQVFAPTADQRYLLGPETFLRTHYPITMRSFRNDGSSELVEEEDLLDQLLYTKHCRPGNRVYILYGAAGSGKSELLKWLEMRIGREDKSRARASVRITRTELDVLRIFERFHHLLSGEYLAEATHRRWQEVRRKPRTFAKLLVLSALEQLLTTDEAVHALYYRVLNVVQPNIERSFAVMDGLGDPEEQAIELLTREDLKQIQAEMVQPVVPDYEVFRHSLLSTFRQQLLEGMKLPLILRQVSEDITRRWGMRPLLFIDDLVQSINLFATDLLDYFITLESGNWDIVVGLTPASFRSSQRGRELLTRLSYLDTIDDRVEKLWLSDEEGRDSYFLDERNCTAYACLYLSEYRRQNGMTCQDCPQYARCIALGTDEDGFPLTPFNRPLLMRIFRGLPEGKGRTRSFTKCLQESLSAWDRDPEPLKWLARHVYAEFTVVHKDKDLARLATLYGPLRTGKREVSLSTELLRAFGFPPEPIVLAIEPLQKPNPINRMAQESSPDWIPDPEKEAIQAWLERKAVNRQLLKRLRRGVARWLRGVYPPDVLHFEGIARPHKVLRRKQTYLGTRPPIILEEVDEGKGISLGRDVGHVAFYLHHYASATGEEAKEGRAHLTQKEELMPILFAAVRYRDESLNHLEASLEIPVDDLVLALYVLGLLVEGMPQERPPGFNDDFWTQLESTHTQFFWQADQFDKETGQIIRDLFEDFFKLRENMYDGPRIAQVLNRRTLNDLLDVLLGVDVERLGKDYRLDGAPLRDVLRTIQELLRNWQQKNDTKERCLPTVDAVLDALETDGQEGVPFSQVPPEIWARLRETKPSIYEKLRVWINP